MKVKKFVAKSMPEAMKQIRKELGSDAVILQNKEVKKGGILGLFKNKRFEVVAALDSTPPEETPQTKKQEVSPGSSPTRRSNPVNNQTVLDEIKYLKELIHQQTFASNHHLPPLYELTYQYLLKQEMDEDIANKLMETIRENDELEEINSKQKMEQALKTTLQEQLLQIPVEGYDDEKQIIQIVGPTGVGKTTTLAKVAAKSILEDKRSVALITMDTYRIAAIDQLKTYARILDVPIEVAYTMDDYQEALRKFQSYDLIFVDTAGRNYRNSQYVHELKATLEIEKKRVDTYLVLSLTSKAQDILDIYQQFEPLGVEKIIFTKLDETLSFGSIFNMMLGEQKQVLYLTNGQNVPDDLLKPTKEQMIKLLLSRYNDG